MIPDTEVLVLLALFGAWLVFFLIAAIEEPEYGILSAIAGFFFGLELWSVTGNVTVTILWLLVATATAVLSIVALARQRS